MKMCSKLFILASILTYWNSALANDLIGMDESTALEHCQTITQAAYNARVQGWETFSTEIPRLTELFDSIHERHLYEKEHGRSQTKVFKRAQYAILKSLLAQATRRTWHPVPRYIKNYILPQVPADKWANPQFDLLRRAALSLLTEVYVGDLGTFEIYRLWMKMSQEPPSVAEKIIAEADLFPKKFPVSSPETLGKIAQYKAEAESVIKQWDLVFKQALKESDTMSGFWLLSDDEEEL